ncbi:MAG: hypothetical protein EOM20_06775 [Spartobacteria bacterium]|nr:hypothetical protein [Spartobacteria bacterium]
MNKDLMKAANEHGSVLLAANDAPQQDGILCAANESSFAQSFYSEPITTYITGWQDPTNLQDLLNYLAPEIQSGRMAEFKKAVNAEQFLTESDDIRAMDADFKRVRFSGETEVVKTLNKGLTLYVDQDRVANEPDWEQRRAAWLLNRLVRNDIIRAINLLSTGATSVTKTWDSSADPDADMALALDAAGDAVGFEPNRAICGKSAWLKRLLAFRAQENAGGFASASMMPDQVADMLGLDRFVVSKARYQSSASAKSKVVGDLVIFFAAEDGQLADDPSNIKRFVSPCSGGEKFRVYVQEMSAKIKAVTVEHYSRLVSPTTLGLRKITVQ